MKVKEVSTTATIAWSPQNVATPHLVCATAAPHADPTNKNDAVQIYSLNLKEENLSMHMEGSISTTTRFHDVVWGVGGSQVKGGHGVVACAGDNGGIYIYNGEQLTVGGSNPLITAMEGKHAGPVFTLDFNHHQPNLLASGSQDCEMFIWDINDPGVPMSPGTKATLAADVTSVAWNRQVEHILASAYAGRCVVFDLRKSTSIIQISDALSRMKANTVCWHPSVATQLALASGDDVTPVCQVWDLRFPSAPIRQCEGHQRGLQDLAWCQQDPTLLCTAAKDNRVVFWNPDNGEIVCELPAYNQWSFKVSWCPRDPALVATATVDGSVSVYSLLGGGYLPPTDVKFSAIADSFPGMEMPTEAPATAQPQHIYPRSPPAFFAAKGGCSFGFGGRLVSWHNGSRAVEVSQVVTEPEVVERGNQLLNLLHSSDLHQYCADKVASKEDDAEKEVWQYISAGLHGEASSGHYLTLLGHPPPPFTPTPHQLSPQEEGALSAQMGGLSATGGSTGSLDPSEQFEMIASAQSDKSPEPELVEPDSPVPESHAVVVCSEGDGGDIRQAVVEGRLQEAVERCLAAGKGALALVLAQHAGEELYGKTRDRVLSLESDPSEVCGLVCAVVRGDLHSVVQQCRLAEWRDAVSTVLTHAPQEHVTGLLQHLGNRLEGAGQQQPALLCYLVAGALDAFVQCWAGSRGGLGGISTQHLQDLVEVMLVLQHSGHIATTPPAEGGSAVGSYLARYASLLATQGSLTTALYYLANNAAVDAQPELSALKDRLSHALGHTAGSGATGRPGSGQFRGRTTSSSSSSQHQSAFRRTSTPSASFQPPQFTPSVQARQASAFPPPSSALPPSGVPQPLPASAQSTPFFQPVQQQTQSYGQPPAMGGQQFGVGYQPVAAPPPPPPPSASLAATVSAAGGLRRPGAVSRYVSHAAPQQQQQQPLPPSSMPGFQPYQPATNQQLQQLQQPASAFLDPGSTCLPPPPPPSASSLPYPPGVDAATSPGGESLKPPAAFDPSVPRGWNDPPPMSATRRAKQQQQQQVAASAAAAAEPVAAMVPSQPTQPSFPPPQQGFQSHQSSFQPSQSTFQPPPTGFQGFQGFQPPSSGPPQALQQQQQRQHPTPTSTPLPLPAEAQKIYDVLNGLYCRAVQTAPNMNVRQTFESIGPKLEVLYDKLRNSQVGSASLQGLQALCAALEAGDYHRALQLHQQTLTAGSFTETAAFMPAIKKMINTCMQCQIFLN